jgi:hypothetical protein
MKWVFEEKNFANALEKVELVKIKGKNDEKRFFKNKEAQAWA